MGPTEQAFRSKLLANWCSNAKIAPPTLEGMSEDSRKLYEDDLRRLFELLVGQDLIALSLDAIVALVRVKVKEHNAEASRLMENTSSRECMMYYGITTQHMIDMTARFQLAEGYWFTPTFKEPRIDETA